MVVWNFTKAQKREARVYSFMNTTISQQGISTSLLKTCAVMLMLFTPIGLAFCAWTGKFWYSPIMFLETANAGYFYIVFIGCPIVLSFMLNSYRVQNYRLLDYLLLVVEPKNPITWEGKRMQSDETRLKGWVERL